MFQIRNYPQKLNVVRFTLTLYRINQEQKEEETNVSDQELSPIIECGQIHLNFVQDKPKAERGGDQCFRSGIIPNNWMWSDSP